MFLRKKRENKERVVCRDDQALAHTISRWGHAASIALFDPACLIFKNEETEGVIGYRMEHGCAVVLGNPLCPPEQIPSLIDAFIRSLKQGTQIVYIVASESFASWFMQKHKGGLLEFGEELSVDPTLTDPTQGASGRRLRNKLSLATREGVRVHEFMGKDLALQQKISDVGEAWLKGRKGRQIFLAHVDLFANPIGRRWFYATRGEEVIGVVLLNQIASQGWLLNLKMVTPESPKGTSELLVINILHALKQEGFRRLTFGAVPRKELGKIENMGWATHVFAKGAYKLAMNIFSCDGTKEFWQKFQPQSEPSYLLFHHPRVSLREIRAVTRALNA